MAAVKTAPPLPNAVGTAIVVGGSLIIVGFALAAVLTPLLRGQNGRPRK